MYSVFSALFKHQMPGCRRRNIRGYATRLLFYGADPLPTADRLVARLTVPYIGTLLVYKKYKINIYIVYSGHSFGHFL